MLFLITDLRMISIHVNHYYLLSQSRDFHYYYNYKINSLLVHSNFDLLTRTFTKKKEKEKTTK